ncbi:MAG: TonB-dependent receptor [Saprospiraceae bacterium]
MIRRNSVSLVLIFILFNVNLTFGQNISGKLLNKNSKQPLPAVPLSLSNIDLIIYTNATGGFTFRDVESGKYSILANINNTLITIREVEISGKDVALGDIEIEGALNTVSDEISVIDVTDLASMENENDNFSSALSAGRDPFVNATAFNLSSGRFRPRGYFNEDSDMLMNGMLMNDQDDGRVLWTAWNSLNDVMRNRSNVINLSESDYTFGGIGGATFIDLRASSQREEKKITYALSNRTFQHRLMGTYSTGMMKNGWAVAATASHSYGAQGFIKGTYIQANSYFLSVDRKLTDKHLLNFVVFGSPQRRGRSTGSVQEMYDLAGTNYYNPNWGYQNGEVRNSREYIIHQPVVMLRHDWKISPNTNVMTNLGFQFGNYGSTRLDWYDAPDPRPDYYRKLPSYALTQEAKDRVTEFLTADEANRQINWQALYNANATRNYTIGNVDGIAGNNVTGKLAAYIQETENYDNQKFNFNSVINTKLGDRIYFTGGVQYLREKVHYYRRVEDLLGADFYIDFNRFALRDFPGNPDAGQNDINRPNRILKEGDIFGHNYDINTSRASVWSQVVYKTGKFDYYGAVSLANQSFYREGYTKVGLFPDNSFGKSETQNFLNIGAKGGITYKLDGRNYFVANGSYRTRAPFANEAYVSPRVRDQIVANLTNEKIAAFDVSYLARYTRFKARISAFYTDFKDKISNDVYYHEEFRTFVNYVMTGIDRKHMGIEFGAEYNLTSKIALTVAGSVGEYYHTSRPLASISRDNSAQDFVQGRVVYIENYYVAGMPQTAGTVGVTYRSSKFWTFNLNVNGFSKNYLSFNPDRRTAEAVATVNPSTESDLLQKIIAEERLPEAFTVDFSAGKSIRFDNGAYLRINLNAGNILNNTNFRTGGFEQLRFDYETKDVSKFPPRYFYSYGTNFNLNVAYIFPR